MTNIIACLSGITQNEKKLRESQLMLCHSLNIGCLMDGRLCAINVTFTPDTNQMPYLQMLGHVKLLFLHERVRFYKIILPLGLNFGVRLTYSLYNYKMDKLRTISAKTVRLFLP